MSKSGSLSTLVKVIGVLVAVLTFLSGLVYSQSPSPPRMSEKSLRKIAKATTKPLFPEDAIRQRQTGVAVAKMTIDESGSVFKVEVLEAPNETIGASLTKALLEWRFEPNEINGRPTKLTGKVTYYFVFQNGKPVVLSPDEAPYLGRQSKR